MIALGVDLLREVEQVLVGARDLTGPDLVGQPFDHLEDRPGHQRRDDRRGKHADLRLLELAAVEREARDQDRDGEADPGDGTTPGDHRPAQGPLQAAEDATGREPRRAENADGLADDVTERDSERDRRPDGITEQLSVDVDARVREREHGHDEVARPRVKLVLKPLVGGDRGRDAPLRATRELGSRLLTERAGQLGRPLEVAARRLVGGRYEPDRQSGDEWIDP